MPDLKPDISLRHRHFRFLETIKSIATAHIFSSLICDLFGKLVECAHTMDRRSYSQFSRLWSHCEESFKANKDCRVRYCRRSETQTCCIYTYYIEQTSSQEDSNRSSTGVWQAWVRRRKCESVVTFFVSCLGQHQSVFYLYVSALSSELWPVPHLSSYGFPLIFLFVSLSHNLQQAQTGFQC